MSAAQNSQLLSPASTSLDELVGLRSLSQALNKKLLKRSSAPMSGPSISRNLGRGLDFAEARQYQPGDDVRMIDWKVTARTGQTHTKLFVEEREQPVLLLVDIRSSMRFATQGMFKSVMASRLAALVGWCAVANRDRVGGYVVADNWHGEVRPQAGRRGLMGLFRDIAHAQQTIPAKKPGALASSLKRLNHGVAAGTTVIIFSDFAEFDEQAERAIGGLLHKLSFVAVQIADPLEINLPAKGQFSFAGRGGQQDRLNNITMDSRKQKQHRQRFEAHTQKLEAFFANGRNRHLLLTCDQALDAASLQLLQAIGGRSL